jgi:hypothetical protein
MLIYFKIFFGVEICPEFAEENLSKKCWAEVLRSLFKNDPPSCYIQLQSTWLVAVLITWAMCSPTIRKRGSMDPFVMTAGTMMM